MAEELQLRIHGEASLPTLIYLPGLHGDWTLIGGFRHALGGRVRFVEVTYPRTLHVVAGRLRGGHRNRAGTTWHHRRLAARRIVRFPAFVGLGRAGKICGARRDSGGRLCEASHARGGAVGRKTDRPGFRTRFSSGLSSATRRWRASGIAVHRRCWQRLTNLSPAGRKAGPPRGAASPAFDCRERSTSHRQPDGVAGLRLERAGLIPSCRGRGCGAGSGKIVRPCAITKSFGGRTTMS